jgi:sec-independent protein translocase protein TatA
MTPLLIGGLGIQEILLITLTVLLLFGGKRISGLAKGIGKGIRNFKQGLNDIGGEPS